MTQFFIGLYDYFERHKILFYLSLIILSATDYSCIDFTLPIICML